MKCKIIRKTIWTLFSPFGLDKYLFIIIIVSEQKSILLSCSLKELSWMWPSKGNSTKEMRLFKWESIYICVEVIFQLKKWINYVIVSGR